MTNKLKLPDGVTITATISPATQEILVPETIELIAALHRNFSLRRKELLQRKQQRQADLHAGKTPDFLSKTENVRRSDWTVAPFIMAPKRHISIEQEQFMRGELNA
jgi:malate synthase